MNVIIHGTFLGSGFSNLMNLPLVDIENSKPEFLTSSQCLRQYSSDTSAPQGPHYVPDEDTEKMSKILALNNIFYYRILKFVNCMSFPINISQGNYKESFDP